MLKYVNFTNADWEKLKNEGVIGDVYYLGEEKHPFIRDEVLRYAIVDADEPYILYWNIESTVAFPDSFFRKGYARKAADFLKRLGVKQKDLEEYGLAKVLDLVKRVRK